MNGRPSDRREIFVRQTHEGKMSLAACVQHLPETRSTDLPELAFDKHGRYVTLNEDMSQQAPTSSKRNTLTSFRRISLGVRERERQTRRSGLFKVTLRESSTVNQTGEICRLGKRAARDREFSSIGSIRTDLSLIALAESSIEERCKHMAATLPLSSADITKQYHLALRNRIEIPPMLMRRVMVDAVGILRIMFDDANRDATRNADRLKRISFRIDEIERLNQLFDRHC